MNERADLEPTGDRSASDELRVKYRKERDKRLRSDGTAQYVDVSGKFEKFARDPYSEGDGGRKPLKCETDVVVVGGGFTGLVTAARLRAAGVEDIRVIEEGSDFGGAWYWNRYPGIRCDVESYIYLPLLEEVGTIPSEKYAKGAEIFGHCQSIARKYDLYRNALFQTSVLHVAFNEESTLWIVRTNRGDEIAARFIVLGTGVLSRPKLPGIPGIEEFKGHAFHTSRWDYKYTGGDTNGNLDGLSGQRVAVIGTGATAVQCIPIIADYAEHLYVFQRTPSSVDERNNRPTDLAWFRSLPHGWQASRILNFARIMSGIADGADLVHDKWTDFWDRYITRLGGADLDLESLKSLLDYEKMGEIRARIEAIVDDPVVAEGLKPYYNYWCKRPLFSDEYLQTFNRANVTLVNTDGRGVEQITEDSLMFDGERFEVDCIIFASGFKAKPPPNESGGFTLVGRNGISMSDKWRRDVRSLHGIYANGFPNLFVVGGVTDASSSANFTHLLTEQSTHVASVIAFCRARGIEMMEVREEAERQWADTLKKKRVYPSEYDAECTPSYFNNEGMLDQPSLRGTVYGGGPLEYFDLCRSWLIADFFRDMKVRCAQKLDGAGETAGSMP